MITVLLVKKSSLLRVWFTRRSGIQVLPKDLYKKVRSRSLYRFFPLQAHPHQFAASVLSNYKKPSACWVWIIFGRNLRKINWKWVGWIGLASVGVVLLAFLFGWNCLWIKVPSPTSQLPPPSPVLSAISWPKYLPVHSTSLRSKTDSLCQPWSGATLIAATLFGIFEQWQ